MESLINPSFYPIFYWSRFSKTCRLISLYSPFIICIFNIHQRQTFDALNSLLFIIHCFLHFHKIFRLSSHFTDNSRWNYFFFFSFFSFFFLEEGGEFSREFSTRFNRARSTEENRINRYPPAPNYRFQRGDERSNGVSEKIATALLWISPHLPRFRTSLHFLTFARWMNASHATGYTFNAIKNSLFTFIIWKCLSFQVRRIILSMFDENLFYFLLRWC